MVIFKNMCPVRTIQVFTYSYRRMLISMQVITFGLSFKFIPLMVQQKKQPIRLGMYLLPSFSLVGIYFFFDSILCTKRVGECIFSFWFQLHKSAHDLLLYYFTNMPSQSLSIPAYSADKLNRTVLMWYQIIICQKF